MRIALVTDYYLPTLGGVQTAVASHLEGLRAAGHDVIVLCPLREESTDPAVIPLPVSARFHPDGFPFSWPPRTLRRRILEILREHRTEVVHTHSEMYAALSAIRVAHDLDLPIVHTMHGRVDVYTSRVLPLPAITTPFLAALHAQQISPRNVRIPGGTSYTQTHAARLMWRLMRAQGEACHQVIVPSRHFAERLQEQGLTTPTSVISNAVSSSVIDTRNVSDTDHFPHSSPLRAMWVGRLSPEKRPEVFAEALRIAVGDGVKSWVQGDVYGEGRSRPRLERTSDVLTLHGAVPQREVIEAMARHDVLVSSSLDFDNQPMVILEAIAAGLPVVYCDPDLTEIIPDGGGFLTEAPTPESLAAMLWRLHDNPDDLARARRAMIAARNSSPNPTAAIVEVYESAIAAHAAPFRNTRTRPRRPSHL